ncbi:phospholipase C [Conexibacter sp. CPCC 206217]|uniref:phospholipase C n=1 Tax=Conexibacter sp. CPCC 206217 TaxID=3064574 RepID=UPI002719769D|nr:alkaline phosphatase family protein [Conexibacter sp. CPCC 206217]MDO8210990.1 alkaline phosphatase family protein [Conexibacter sp. CPCC 206217]
MRKRRFFAAGGLATLAVTVGLTVAHADSSPPAPTDTPIKHVVVIFDENESFDHYFGTYPNAANPPGEPQFTAKENTPSVNGLSPALLTSNPNSLNPKRLDRSEAFTCSQSHSYGSEQKAFDGGLMDGFVEFTAGGGSLCPSPVVMNYYDGNTVTALWNLAQHFSMSDNSFGTGFGPSTPGALNLVSGNTSGATSTAGGATSTVTSDPEPSAELDDCAKASGTTVMTGKNVGDLLNSHNLTWGWFQGGMRPTGTDPATGKAICGASHKDIVNFDLPDYSAHHNAFAYYRSTANPHHLPPSSPEMIGRTDQANHQYDLQDFDTVLADDNLPAVSYLKAANSEDGHPGSSDPIDEQRWIARTVNAIQQSPAWSSTAIVIAYDDSDGWYDHVMSPIVNPSASSGDALNGPGRCGVVKDPTAAPGRCGYGPRLPLLVVSPFAKQNFVDHSVTDQTSILKFIEDNWQLGRIGDGSMDVKAGSLANMFDFDPNHARAPKVLLDPTTGVVLNHPADTGTPGSIGESSTPRPAGDDPGQGDDDPSGDDPGQGDDDPSGDGGDRGDGTNPPRGGDRGGTPGRGGRRSGSTGSTPKPPQVKVTCTTKASGKKIFVSCKVTGKDAKTGKTALRFRVVKNEKVLATARAVVKSGRASVTLRTKSKVRSGKYQLRIAIAHSGGANSSLTRTVKLG